MINLISIGSIGYALLTVILIRWEEGQWPLTN